MSERPHRELGERLRAARRASKLTQETVATQVGVKREIVSQWESGSRRPGQENLIKLAAIYGITTDALYGLQPLHQRHPNNPEGKGVPPIGSAATPAPADTPSNNDTDWRRILNRLSRALEIQAEANLEQAKANHLEASAHQEQAKAVAEASRAAYTAIQVLAGSDGVPPEGGNHSACASSQAGIEAQGPANPTTPT